MMEDYDEVRDMLVADDMYGSSFIITAILSHPGEQASYEQIDAYLA